MKRFIKIFAVLMIIIIAVLCFLYFHHPRGLNQYNAARIAGHETRMWKAYYSGDRFALGKELVLLLCGQFGLSLPDAIDVGRDLAQATLTFRGSGKDDYAQKVLPVLERAYSKIKLKTDAKWDAGEAAAAELEWWVDRRTSSRSSPEIVGQSIAHLYAVLYGETNPEIEKAGLLRAQAAELRDAKGANADWTEIQRMLEESYGELVKGVQNQAP